MLTTTETIQITDTTTSFRINIDSSDRKDAIDERDGRLEVGRKDDREVEPEPSSTMIDQLLITTR
jgi:hypothetical protein